MNNILVTGSNGQLGNEIRMLAPAYPDWHFFFTDVEELDITNRSAIDKFLSENDIDIIINCASYTAVDKAEEDGKIAEQVNAEAVKYLAASSSAANAFMIHISTDYVFDGEKSTPYQEEDIPNPLSVYAETKYIGENLFLENIKRGVLIRTSWLYSEFGHNFVKTMIRLGRERDELGIVFDQVGTPTYAGDLAKALMQIVTDQERFQHPEIYHFSNEGVASWFDFAHAVIRLKNIDCIVNPIETKDYPLPAKRPFYSLMSKSKFKKDFSYRIPHWRESLKHCISKLDSL